METNFTTFRMTGLGIEPTTWQSHGVHCTTGPLSISACFFLLCRSCSHFCHPSTAAFSLCCIVRIRWIWLFPWFPFYSQRENTRRTPVTSVWCFQLHVLICSTAPSLCSSAKLLWSAPSWNTLLRLSLRVCRHIWRNQTRAGDWLSTFHRPAAGHAPWLWSEARYERLTALGEIIRWLSRILNWADWAVGETSWPPQRHGEDTVWQWTAIGCDFRRRHGSSAVDISSELLFFLFLDTRS